MSDKVHYCRQCHEEYTPSEYDDGFCSDPCEQQWDHEISCVDEEDEC